MLFPNSKGIWTLYEICLSVMIVNNNSHIYLYIFLKCNQDKCNQANTQQFKSHNYKYVQNVTLISGSPDWEIE